MHKQQLIVANALYGAGAFFSAKSEQRRRMANQMPGTVATDLPIMRLKQISRQLGAGPRIGRCESVGQGPPASPKVKKVGQCPVAVKGVTVQGIVYRPALVNVRADETTFQQRVSGSGESSPVSDKRNQLDKTGLIGEKKDINGSEDRLDLTELRLADDCTSNLISDSNQTCHLVRLKRSPIRKPEFQWVTLRFSREHNRCYRICDRLAGCDLGRSAGANPTMLEGGRGGAASAGAETNPMGVQSRGICLKAPPACARAAGLPKPPDRLSGHPEQKYAGGSSQQGWQS